MKGYKKPRKRRGIKLDGTRSMDLCPGCYSFNCDPFAMSRKFQVMVHRRLKEGRCVACGHHECTCKSSLSSRKQ